MPNMQTSDSGIDAREAERDLEDPEDDRPADEHARVRPAEERDRQGRGQRAEPGRRHEEPVALGAGAEDVLGQRRDDDREVHPDVRDETDDRHAEQDDGSAGRS